MAVTWEFENFVKHRELRPVLAFIAAEIRQLKHQLGELMSTQADLDSRVTALDGILSDQSAALTEIEADIAAIKAGGGTVESVDWSGLDAKIAAAKDIANKMKSDADTNAPSSATPTSDASGHTTLTDPIPSSLSHE